jgi:mersacidin/lichenicidin family type 2 lantibiotic
MSNLDIIRAWKDPEFRATLADVPPHPAGEIEIELAGLGLDGPSTLQGKSFFVHCTRHCTLFGEPSCG